MDELEDACVRWLLAHGWYREAITVARSHADGASGLRHEVAGWRLPEELD